MQFFCHTCAHGIQKHLCPISNLAFGLIGYGMQTMYIFHSRLCVTNRVRVEWNWAGLPLLLFVSWRPLSLQACSKELCCLANVSMVSSRRSLWSRSYCNVFCHFRPCACAISKYSPHAYSQYQMLASSNQFKAFNFICN